MGKYKRLDNKEWVLAKEANTSIQIIQPELWNRTQEKRKLRGKKYVENFWKTKMLL